MAKTFLKIILGIVSVSFMMSMLSWTCSFFKIENSTTLDFYKVSINCIGKKSEIELSIYVRLSMLWFLNDWAIRILCLLRDSFTQNTHISCCGNVLVLFHLIAPLGIFSPCCLTFANKCGLLVCIWSTLTLAFLNTS